MACKVVTGKNEICSNKESLDIYDELNKIYQNRIESLTVNDPAEVHICVYREWIRELLSQNGDLACLIDELEREASERIKKFQQRCEDLMKKLRIDIKSLIEVIQRAIHKKKWDPKGLKFYTIRPEDIFGNLSNSDIAITLNLQKSNKRISVVDEPLPKLLNFSVEQTRGRSTTRFDSTVPLQLEDQLDTNGNQNIEAEEMVKNDVKVKKKDEGKEVKKLPSAMASREKKVELPNVEFPERDRSRLSKSESKNGREKNLSKIKTTSEISGRRLSSDLPEKDRVHYRDKDGAMKIVQLKKSMS